MVNTFRNTSFDLKDESPSDEDEKEEGMTILPEAPSKGIQISMS